MFIKQNKWYEILEYHNDKSWKLMGEMKVAYTCSSLRLNLMGALKFTFLLVEDFEKQ